VPQTRKRVIFVGVREDLDQAPAFPSPWPYRYTMREGIGDVLEQSRPAPDVPLERRQLTIPEVKRLCGFPDDYVLTGSRAKQWERLGDSVPPPMMRAIAEALRDGPLAAVSASRGVFAARAA
jgi:DNA (cytosine-5)-methyltransferase 1